MQRDSLLAAALRPAAADTILPGAPLHPDGDPLFRGAADRALVVGGGAEVPG
ncbi:MAG: hypothetical protein H0W11_12540, partial [Gemmatimonadetes bacterium]|nr:hypothetical protein [Gemmatimonadota bacterium]